MSRAAVLTRVSQASRLCLRCTLVTACAALGILLLPVVAVLGTAVYTVLIAGMGAAMLVGLMGPACADRDDSRAT
jgi:hypothetical protein